MHGFARAVTAAMAALLGGAPAMAHHSGAMFDRARLVSISGTVKEFQYTNPHSWLMVTATSPDGSQVEWGFESEGPSTLLRNGIKRSTFEVGEKVTVSAYPMKDGRPAGALISVTKTSGQTIRFRGGMPNSAAAGAPPPAG